MNLIEKSGVYRLTMEQYHGQPCEGPSISSSGLRTIFKESPAHYWLTSSLNPKAEPQDDTEAFTLGRAAHHLLLGEDAFSTLFVVRPDKWDSWRTNDAKAWKAGQEDAGRTVLLPSQLEQIRGMARALAEHPLVEAGILNGEIEQSLLWRDKETGIWLKARPDAIPNASGDFADLKTTVNYGFDLDRDVSKHRYDMQAAVTAMACREVLKREMESFSLVFVGKKPPFCVEILTLGKDDIAEAEKDVRSALHTFRWCIDHNNWFGPGGTQNDARYVHISEWERKSAEFRREFLAREIAPPKTQQHEAADYLAAG